MSVINKVLNKINEAKDPMSNPKFKEFDDLYDKYAVEDGTPTVGSEVIKAVHIIMWNWINDGQKLFEDKYNYEYDQKLVDYLNKFAPDLKISTYSDDYENATNAQYDDYLYNLVTLTVDFFKKNANSLNKPVSRL